MSHTPNTHTHTHRDTHVHQIQTHQGVDSRMSSRRWCKDSLFGSGLIVSTVDYHPRVCFSQRLHGWNFICGSVISEFCKFTLDRTVRTTSQPHRNQGQDMWWFDHTFVLYECSVKAPLMTLWRLCWDSVYPTEGRGIPVCVSILQMFSIKTLLRFF